MGLFPPCSLPQVHVFYSFLLGPCDQAIVFLELLLEGRGQDQRWSAGSLTVDLTIGASNSDQAVMQV